MYDQDFFNQRSVELAPYEDAARIWCATKGEEPDRKIRVKHPSIAGAFVFYPFWLQIAEEMLDLSTLLSSMKRAAAKKAKKEPEPGHA